MALRSLALSQYEGSEGSSGSCCCESLGECPAEGVIDVGAEAAGRQPGRQGVEHAGSKSKSKNKSMVRASACRKRQ